MPAARHLELANQGETERQGFWGRSVIRFGFGGCLIGGFSVIVHTLQPTAAIATCRPVLRPKVLASACPGGLMRHLRIRALRAAMAELGVTIGQLARRCAVDRKRVARWLDGARIDEESLRAMGPIGERYCELMEAWAA